MNLQRAASSAQVPAGGPPPRVGELCRRYVEAQLAGDRREALRLVIQDGLARSAAASS